MGVRRLLYRDSYPMKILFVMHPNTALTYDTQIFMSDFVKNGFKVYFLSSFIGHQGPDRKILPENENFLVYTIPNFYIEAFDRFIVYKVARNFLVQALLLLKTAYLSFRHNIDVFITLGGFVESGFVPLICSRMLNKPFIVRVVSDPSRDVYIRIKNTLIYRIYRKAEKKILKEASRIITLDGVEEQYKNKTLVIPHKVDTQIFQRININGKYELYNLDKSDFILLYVGRITEEKGVKILAESFPAILEKVPNAKLLLVGKGNLENYVKRFVKTSGLENQIRLLGEKTRNELSELYNVADVTILLSLVEGTPNPNVILESLACDTPVITTRVGKIPGIVENGKNGFIVDLEINNILNAVLKIPDLKEENLNKAIDDKNKRYDEGIKNLMEIIRKSNLQ